MIRAAFLFTALTVTATAAPAQTRWERQVQDQLQLVAQDLAPRGFHPAGEPFSGRLSQGRAARFRLALRPNVTYALVGLCDEDCRNLDLRLIDQQDRPVTTSTAGGDKPFLQVTAETGGKFTLVVTMAQCGTPPCSFGVGIFSK